VLVRVLWVEGNARYAIKATSEFTPLRQGITLARGSIVRSADGSKINLALFPGALVQIGSNTELQIGEVALTKNGNETDDGMRNRLARLDLKHGSILTLLDPAAKFTVTTPHGRINVTPGCLFLLETEQAKTRLMCARGEIDLVLGDGRNLALEAPYVLESTGRDTVVKSAANDARAQANLANASAAEHELRELQSRQSARPPFLSAR
jgi:hypothetical protein